MGSRCLLQGTFSTQGSNPGLPHCRRILYQLSHQGSPRILEWVAHPFSSTPSWPRKRTGSPALQRDSLPAELPGKPIYSPWERTKGGFFTSWAMREAHCQPKSVQSLKEVCFSKGMPMAQGWCPSPLSICAWLKLAHTPLSWIPRLPEGVTERCPWAGECSAEEALLSEVGPLPGQTLCCVFLGTWLGAVLSPVAFGDPPSLAGVFLVWPFSVPIWQPCSILEIA